MIIGDKPLTAEAIAGESPARRARSPVFCRRALLVHRAVTAAWAMIGPWLIFFRRGHETLAIMQTLDTARAEFSAAPLPAS
jgi:hypothetical protein